MEQTIFEMIIEAIPFLSNAVICGVVIGFVVYAVMKFYGRFVKVEETTSNLKTSVSGLTQWTINADRRFDKIEGRLDNIDTRIGSLDKRMDNLDKRIDSLETKLETKLDQMDEKFEKKFDKMERKFDSLIEVLLQNSAQSKSLKAS